MPKSRSAACRRRFNMIQSAVRFCLTGMLIWSGPISSDQNSSAIDPFEGSIVNVVIHGTTFQYQLIRYDPPTTHPADVILIPDLSRVELQAGRHYQLAPGHHTLNRTIRIPENCTLDATGATVEFTGRDWSAAIGVNGVRGATLVGGTWTTGKLNFVVDSSNARSFTMREVHLIDGGGLIQARGASNMLIENCSAEIVERNFIYFGDSPNRDITIRNVRLIDGSRAESGIRIHRTTNLLIEDCDIRATRNKKSALRLHDGANFLVKNSRFFGYIGAGPLAEGDGGRRWGIDLFIGLNGKRTVDPAQANIFKTSERRRERLALRADGVRLENVTVEGSVVLKAGVIGFDMRGGSIAPQGNARAFEQTTMVYPELPKWRLPGDVLRPAPSGQLVGVTIMQSRPDLNAPIPLVDCLIKEKEILEPK